MTLLDRLCWRESEPDVYLYSAGIGYGKEVYAKVVLDASTERWNWQVTSAVSTGFYVKEDAMQQAEAYVRTHPDLLPYPTATTGEPNHVHQRRSGSRPEES